LRKVPELVAEAEIVRIALVRTKRLKRGLRISAEILAVAERRLLGEFHQPDVDQASGEVSRQIGCVRLDDRERLDELRREEIEGTTRLDGSVLGSRLSFRRAPL
jgi:hypothetical protein